MRVNRADLLEKLLEVVARETADPGAELVKVGQALVKIGEVLRGVPGPEAVAAIQAVAIIHGIKLP